MRSKVKTGDVIQIRKNGPNYITLGKVRDKDGIEYIAATKNGNITKAGLMKKSSGSVSPKIRIISGNKVKRVHQTRTVNIESVVSQNRRLSTHLERTTNRNGIRTEAPNIMASIAELQANL